MVESLTRGGVSYKVRGAVQVTVWEPVVDLRSGDVVGCIGILKVVHNFNNPGGFDYRRYLAFRGIRATASVSKKNHVVRLHPAKGWGLRRGIELHRIGMGMGKGASSL